MPRITKKPEVRYAELVDAAEKLFDEKGYEATAVSDIVQSIGVAQGTFYYYFKSKKHVMDAVVERTLTNDTDELVGRLARSRKSPGERISYILNATFNTFQKRRARLLTMTQRTLSFNIFEQHKRLGHKLLIPLYESIIKEGISKGVFQVEDPREASYFILLNFDTMIFDNEDFVPESLVAGRRKTVRTLVERLLGMKEGTFKL